VRGTCQRGLCQAHASRLPVHDQAAAGGHLPSHPPGEAAHVRQHPGRLIRLRCLLLPAPDQRLNIGSAPLTIRGGNPSRRFTIRSFLFGAGPAEGAQRRASARSSNTTIIPPIGPNHRQRTAGQGGYERTQTMII
jgi:hypothetical protein